MMNNIFYEYVMFVLCHFLQEIIKLKRKKTDTNGFINLV